MYARGVVMNGKRGKKVRKSAQSVSQEVGAIIDIKIMNGLGQYFSAKTRREVIQNALNILESQTGIQSTEG